MNFTIKSRKTGEIFGLRTRRVVAMFWSPRDIPVLGARLPWEVYGEYAVL